jgi:hypothetical protein
MFLSRPLFCTALLLSSSFLLSQTPAPVAPGTKDAACQLIGDIMMNGQAYEYDRQLADTIGPRLTGSDNYTHAVSWAMEQFKSLGLSNVHTEPFTMKATWEPEEPAVGRIIEPRIQNLHIYSYGWSPSTPPGGIKGHVIYLSKLNNETIAAESEKLSGKIILIDRDSYELPLSFKQFFGAIDHLKDVHPLAVMVVGGANGTESASSFSFDASISPYPIAQVGREDALLIKRILEHGPVTAEFSFKNRIRTNVTVNNVVAEIPGRESPNEVVIVGGHLDSWHPATGAQDNGTGSATVIEVARAIKALSRPPRRTMRFILFGGEEQGIIGSTAYVRAHKNEMSKIDAVLISDTGGEPAKGWYLMGRSDEKQALANIEPLLKGIGSDETTPDTEFLFQTDHIGFDLLGVPTMVLWTGVEKYFKLHHKASDSFDAVVQADLNQGVATTAVTAYVIADSAQPFAPHDTPDQVEQMLKDTKQFDDYQYFKEAGIFP